MRQLLHHGDVCAHIRPELHTPHTVASQRFELMMVDGGGWTSLTNILLPTPSVRLMPGLARKAANSATQHAQRAANPRPFFFGAASGGGSSTVGSPVVIAMRTSASSVASPPLVPAPELREKMLNVFEREF